MSVALQQGIWTPEKRLEQSRALRGRQIWLKSTGPRTPEGKATSSRNARKEGYEDRMAERLEMRRIKAYLRLQKLFIDTLRFQSKNAERLASHANFRLEMQLNFLENELMNLELQMFDGLLFSEIIGLDNRNIIPFPARPPH